MCGLVGAMSLQNKPVNKVVKDTFMAQRNRGLDGFGIWDNDYKNMVHETEESGILNWLDKHPSNFMLFHHRIPTSTDNVKPACHPFATKDFFGDTQYILIHNGWLTNSRDLKKDHDKLGIEYRSYDCYRFNDSEALLWDFALYMEGQQEKMESVGHVAFIAMEIGKDKNGKKYERLHYYRNTGSPLVAYKDKKKFILSSQGKGATVPVDKLHTLDTNTLKLTQHTLEIPTYVASNWQGNDYQSTTPYSGQFDGYKEVDGGYWWNGHFYPDKDSVGDTIEDDDEDELIIKHAMQQLVNDTLAKAKGYYEEAFFILQDRLDDINASQDPELYFEKIALEGAQQLLCDDPDWDGKDPNARHPLFDAEPVGSQLTNNSHQLALPTGVYTIEQIVKDSIAKQVVKTYLDKNS